MSGKIANLTKTASKPGGISLFTNENKTTYKSTYQLLKEISEIYDDLTDKQQAGLLEALAGKRQGQIVAATLKNFDAAEEALQNMTNSAGSAEAEMETIRESAQYALNELKETFTSLAQHSVSRGGLKDLIKFGTWALEIVDKIVGKLGLIPAILTTTVGIIASKKATKGGLFGYNGTTGKLMVGGVDFKKGWLGNLKAQKAEIVANKQALVDFETEMNKGVVSQQAWNRVMNNSNATVRKFGEGIMNGTVTAQGYAEAVGQVGVKAKLAAVGVRALNTVVSMVTSLLISAALGAVIKAIDNSVHAIENNVDKISELTDKEKSLKSEIKNINEQLSDTKLKINELERQDKLTLLEQGELENLKAANDELERQLRLKRGELANTSNEKNKEAQRLWTGMTTHASDRDLTKWYNWWAVIPGAREIGNIVRAVNGEQTDWTDYVPLIGQSVEALGNVSKISRGETWEQQILELEIYKKGLKELEEMKKSSDYMNGDDDAEKRVEETEKSLKSLRDTIQKYYNGNWTALSTGLDPALEENKEILEKVNAVMKEWDNLNKKTYSNFAEIYNDPKFAVTKKQLEELARAGKLNVEIFNELSETDVTGINNFRNELENIENLTVDEVIESIVEETEQLDKAAKKSGMSVDEYTEYLEKLHNALDAVVDKQEKLADAFTKTRLGTALSPQEAYELIKEMPNIKKYLEKMGDGYTISTEGFNAVSNENLENEKQKLADSISLAKEQIELFKELQKTSLELNNSNGQDTELIERFTKLSEATKEMREKLGVKSMGELEDGIAKLQEQLSGDELYLDVITEAFDSYAIIGAYEDMKSAVSDYNDEIEKLDSAIKTLNEGGVLSYDEMVSLVEIAPELNGLFDQLGDGYTVSTETLEEWRQKSYDARNEYIDGLLKQVEATKSAAIDERDAYERVLQVQEKFGDEAQKLAAQVDLDAANERIKKIDEITAVLLAMKKEILSGNEEDNTNALQDEIDYYKTIISAVEIVKNKYAEALDKEIDVLQDSKDALKDANDERQREIDLREALINLENAKKRKVWVFSDDGGFRQEQDKGAVKEAEEKYRDAITDIQEAEIDKQIELREKQKEQLEESVKDLTELESKINDAKTVAQAMAALGLTDEKDLLTLSDDVKESIKEGLADAVTQKEAEENKENNWYKKVTLDDVLKAFGAKVTADEVKNMDLPTLKSYNAAQTLANDIKKWTEETVASTVNNNTNSNVFSPTVNVQGIVTEEKIADVVVDKLKDVFMEYGNSIK